MFKFIDWFFDRLFIVLGALLGSQIPAWVQQYSQRLGGHVNELKYLIEKLTFISLSVSKTPEEYMHKLIGSSDPDVVKQGEFIQAIFERSEALSYASKRLSDCSIWERPFVLIRTIDYDVAISTLASFQPSLSMTIEGLCYTAIGILFGCLIYQGLVKLFKSFWNRFKSLFSKKLR